MTALNDLNALQASIAEAVLGQDEVIRQIIVGLLAFTTGSFWGVAAIAFPIIVPLADSMGVSLLLVSGAVISAASLGSHTCFYGDAVTLTSSACQIRNNDYARTVLPIVVLPFVLGCIAFLVAGVIL